MWNVAPWRRCLPVLVLLRGRRLNPKLRRLYYQREFFVAVRDSILIDLVKEVLGPRDGPYEPLPSNQNPRDEYITGVLAPVGTSRPPDDIDADADAVIEETTGEEDQDSQDSVVAPSVFSPALDPKALPRL
jgi:hypothetical protein